MMKRTLFAVLVLLFAARLLAAAYHNSFTIDEPHYLGTGLYLWESGDYHPMRSLRLHPPLTFHLASLPLLAFDLEGSPVQPGIGSQLINGPASRAIRVACRLPFLCLAVWGALLCGQWAREIAGATAGLLALLLITFSPLYLAHGSLIHSDITVTVLFLQTLYAAWRLISAPSPLRLLICGISLGLALLAKHSALLLLGILPLLLLAHAFGWLAHEPSSEFSGRLSSRRGRAAAAACKRSSSRLGWVARTSAGLFACALGVLWLGYGGSFAAELVGSGPLEGMRLPGYLHSLIQYEAINSAGRDTYLWGEFSQQGWWYYFPAAFAIKSPGGLLVLLALAIASKPSRLTRFVAVPIFVYLGVALFVVDIPLGLRYLLPLYPLLVVFIAVQLIPIGKGLRRVAIVGCCGWIAISSGAAHPHYLAYFNEFAGGPARGPQYLLDANIDWGQDLGTLAGWLAERGNPQVALAYFGPERPERYGIRALPLQGCQPRAGLIAISVNYRWHLYDPRNPFTQPRRDCYRWLDAHQPVARPGGSILVYDVPESRAHRTIRR